MTRADDDARPPALTRTAAGAGLRGTGGARAHGQPHHAPAARRVAAAVLSRSPFHSRGRPPDSPEWYHTANVLFRAEASIVGVLYRRLRHANLPPGQALVAAYRHYRNLCGPEPRISFDRAFDLASHLDGVWITGVKSFSIAHCPQCHSEHLAAIGGLTQQADGCPFCKVIQRYRSDPRVQTSFPTLPLIDPAQVILGIDLLCAEASQADGDIPVDRSQ